MKNVTRFLYNLLNFKATFLKALAFFLISITSQSQSTLDWSTATWNDGDLTGTIPLTTPAGFMPQNVTITLTADPADGAFLVHPTFGTFPRVDLVAGSFGAIDDLAIAFGPLVGRPNPESPVTITMTFSTPVRDLVFNVSDIDFDPVSLRGDGVSVTSDAGDPESITIVNPGSTTITLVDTTVSPNIIEAVNSSNSDNDDFGSAIVDFGSKLVSTVTVVYYSSNDSDGLRGAGFVGNFNLFAQSVLAANDNTGTAVTEGVGGTAVADVLTNDVFQTGAPTLTDVTITQLSTTNPGVTIDTGTGAVNVASSVPSGNCTLVYQICETSYGTNNCDTASVAVTVLPDADNDDIDDITDLDDDNDGILDNIECGGTLNVTFVSSNAVPSDSGGAFGDPANTANGIINQIGGAGNDGFIYDTTSSGMENPEFNYSFTVPADTFAYEFEMYGTVGSLPGEQLKSYSITIFDSSNAVVHSANSSSTILPNGTPLSSSGFSLPAGNYTVTMVDNDGAINNREFSEVRFLTCQDTDDDGIIDSLDPDSDNDGCADANEAYNDAMADSNGDGTYGGVVGPTEVNPDGTVIGATYPGTNANVTTATQVTVTTPPSNQAAIAGNPATFTVAATAVSTTTYAAGVPDYTIPPATDVSGTLVYQWQENGVDLADGGVYSGATTATLNISDNIALDGNVYNVIITHPDNVCVDEQNSALLSILPDSDGDDIDDATDLDDDNDGILDSEECDSFLPVGPNLIANGDFETGDVTGFTTDLTENMSPSAAIGTYYITTNTNLTNYWGAVEDNNNVAPGDQYIMVVDAKTGAPEQSVLTQSVILNAGGTYELSYWTAQMTNSSINNPPELVFEVDGIEYPFTVAQYETQSSAPLFDWVKLSSFITLPTGGSIVIRLINKNLNSGSGNNFSVDDISIREVQCTTDTDGDSIVDSLDPDSDNDGCADANEAYNDAMADSNGDGTYGGVVGPTEVNPDGTVIGATYPGTNANVTTATQVAVTTAPVDQTEAPGDPATFTVVATAVSTTTYAAGVPDYTIPPATDVSGALVYQWQENGVDLADGGVYSGATTATLNISDVTGLDANVYNVIVTHPDNVCVNEQNSATLTEDPLPIATDDTGDYTPGSASDPIDILANDTTGDTVVPTTVDLDPTTGLPAGSSCTATDADGDCVEVTVPGEGVWTVDETTGATVFTPDPTFTGDPSPITYSVEDAEGNSDTATITVTAILCPSAVDSDGDGLTDCEETTGIDDPSTTAVPVGMTNPNDACDPIGLDTTDTDDDGLTDCEETTGIDDPSTPLDPGGVTSDPLDPCSPDVSAGGCNPTAVDDTAGTTLDTDVIIDITANDIDPNGTIDDSTIDLDPSTPGQQSTYTVPGEGTYTDNGDGTITFDPDPTFTGVATPITYTVNDNDGNVTNPANVSVTVASCPGDTTDSDGDGLTDCEETTGIDDPSTTGVPVGMTNPNDACDPIGAVTNDSDGDGLTDCEETTGIDDPSTPLDPGGVTSDPTDACSPNTASAGCIPVAVDDDATTTTDTDVMIDITGNDSDPNGTIDDSTIDLDPSQPGQQSTITIPGEGTYTDNGDGTITFDPDPVFNGTSTITYTVNDNDGNTSNEATVTVIIPACPGDTTDTDGDGLTDCEETTGIDDPSTTGVPMGTSDPNDGCSPIGINTVDTDSDGLTDCEETTGIDDPSTPLDPGTLGVDPMNPSDPTDPCDPIGINTTDTDSDGLTDCEETTGIDDPSTPLDPNDFPGGGISDPNDGCSPVGINTVDTDGDGLTDCEETTGVDDPSTPLNPGDYSTGGMSNPNDGCDPIVDAAGCTPIANDDMASTDTDVDVIIDITGNDTDANGTIDDSTVDLDPSTPGQQSTITIPGEGTYTDNGDGTITFDPDPTFEGTSTITYTVNDNDGNTSNEATVTVTISTCPSPVDTDNDGLTDCEETTGIDDPSTPLDPGTFGVDPMNPSDPSDPCDPVGINTTDTDNDGLTDCEETTGIDDPSTPLDPGTFGVDPMNPSDPSDPCDPVGINTTDTDNDGLTDCEETTGIDDPSTPLDPGTFGVDPMSPSDPNDPCDPVGINTVDTDGDGLTDCEETTGIDDPSTTAVPTGTSDPTDGCDPIGINTTDTDNDGLTDCEETTGIDDPSTPLDPGTFGVDPMNPSDPNDPCDPIGINTTDTDNDGLTDCEETTGIDDPSTTSVPTGTSDPNDGCSPNTDAGGCTPIAVDDNATTTPDTNVIIPILNNDNDPNGTLDPSTISITTPGAMDTNGDGYNDTVTIPGEGTYTVNPDGTMTFDPEPTFDGTSTITYTVEDNDGNTSNEATVTVVIPNCPSPIDTDGDGLTDCEETTGIDDLSTPLDPGTFGVDPMNPSDPNDPCDPLGINTVDTDGDGLTDCEETTGIDDPSTPLDPGTFGVDPMNPSDPNDPCDPIGINTVDTDGDGLTDCEETTGIDDPSTPLDPGTFGVDPMNPSDPNDACDPVGINTVDTDGDGLTDCEETTGIDDPSTPLDPGTFGVDPMNPSDPNDPCDPIGINTVDTDGDGLTDCEETTGVDDPSTTAIPTGTSDETDPCDPFGVNTADTDGDGLTDCEEITGMDDPSTPLDPGGVTSDPNDECSPTPGPTCLPVANPDVYATDPDVDITVDITGNDTDPDGTINPSTINITTPGAIDTNGDGYNDTVTIPGEGTYTANPDGTITFDPDPGLVNGMSTITYTVEDNEGNTSNETTVTITIPINCPSPTDTDGDGLTDCEETTGIDDPTTPLDPGTFGVDPSNPSNPNDPCDPVGINTTDTDGDGLTDCEETTGIDDPSTTTVPTGPSDPNDACSPVGISTTDTDNDGLTDCEETTGIDDPSTPLDPGTFGVDPINPSDPNDPCDPVGINTTDTDGDGLTDCEETTGIDDPSTPLDPGTFGVDPMNPSDPNDPCDPISINRTDTDGDGLTDCEETTGIDDPTTPLDPGTFGVDPMSPSDPNDPCDPIGIDTTDTDGDGLTDCEETTGTDDPSTTSVPTGTSDPTDGCSPIGINTTDTDGDGLTDCEETTGIDDPSTPLDPGTFGVDPMSPSDPNDPCDPIGINTTDTDGDGLSDCEETTGTDDPSTTGVPTGTSDPTDGCSPIGINTTDTDNDGLTDCEETTGIDDPSTPLDPGTFGVDPMSPSDPNDPCDPIGANTTDTDGDGLSDCEETTGIDDPSTVLVPDGTSDETDGCDPGGISVPTADCDGDGVPNGVELDPDGDGTPGPNGTDPEDPCSFNESDRSLPVTSTEVCDEAIMVYTSVTPNGDGENDVFMIANIERYPNNTVRIFNRWGVIVYETRGYNNTSNAFRGESNGRVTVNIDDQLPVGTYFYVIEYERGNEMLEEAGYLYIQR